MAFRISTASGEDETIIRLEGRLDARGVTDLTKVFQAAAATVLLDLSGLQSADAEGVLALQSFAAKGTKLVGASLYIHELLKETSSRGKENGQ